MLRPTPLYFLTSPLGISDDKTREELLFTHNLTLTKTIYICCAKEAASLHMKALKSEEINKVTHNSNKKKRNLVTANTKLKENLEIIEKESAGQRKILAKENLEKLVIRVLLKESVFSSPNFT